MSWPPEALATPRLRLRKPFAADAPLLFERLSGDPEVTRYLGWPTHTLPEQSRQQISLDLLRWSRGAAWTWIIEDEAGLIGMFQFSVIAPHLLRTGCMLARSHQGRGLMSEVLARMIREAFCTPGFYRVEALCDVENLPSFRMLTRAGMHCEGRLASYILHPNLSSLPRDAFMFASSRPIREDPAST